MTDRTDTPKESFIDRMRRSRAEASATQPDLLDQLQSGEPSEWPLDEKEDEKEDENKDGNTNHDTNQVPDAHSTSTETDPQEPRMPAEARRVLVSLMRQGVVLASKKAKVFEALVRHEAPIRDHLAEVYLQLVLDERAGVAFIASIASEHGNAGSEGEDLLEEVDDDPDGASLISRRTLSLYDTLLLLVLRKHYQDREVAGEQRIVIDTERVEAALVPFLPLTNSERNDRRKLGSALTRMVEKRLLTRVRGSDERFEITPVIRYVVSAEFLESLLAEYVRLAGEEGGADAVEGIETERLAHEFQVRDSDSTHSMDAVPRSPVPVAVHGRSDSGNTHELRSNSAQPSLTDSSFGKDRP